MPSDPLESSNLYTNTPMIFYITIIVLHTKYLFLCRNNR
jgi:hypothetical protein